MIEYIEDEIEKAKALKNAMKLAIEKFNSKPKRGIKILLQLGIIQEGNSKDLADFLF